MIYNENRYRNVTFKISIYSNIAISPEDTIRYDPPPPPIFRKKMSEVKRSSVLTFQKRIRLEIFICFVAASI